MNPKKKADTEPEAARYDQADTTPTSPAPSGDDVVRPLDAEAPERAAVESQGTTSPAPSVSDLVAPRAFERPEDQVLPVQGMTSRLINPVGKRAERAAAYAE